MMPITHIVLPPLLLTVKVALLATLGALVLGTPLAFLVSRFAFPGRDWLDAGVVVPMVLPPTVLGYYLMVMVGRRSVAGAWVERVFGVSLTFTWQGAVVAAAVVALPLVFISARAAFDGVDRNLENAARTLGASRVAVFLRVALPLAGRGIFAGAVLAFARAMGEFGATLMIAGNMPGRTQTLSMAVYDAVQAGNDAQATLLVAVTSAVSVGMLLLSGKLNRGRRTREGRAA